MLHWLTEGFFDETGRNGKVFKSWAKVYSADAYPLEQDCQPREGARKVLD